MGGVLEVSRDCDRFPSKFQNFERHCRNSSLFLVKCSFTAVALKILKLAWEPIAGPWDSQNPPHFRLFSIQWWPQIIDMSESKWPKFFDMTKSFWPKKGLFFWFVGFPWGPGGARTKNSEIFLYMFTESGKLESGKSESGGCRDTGFRNLEWDGW